MVSIGIAQLKFLKKKFTTYYNELQGNLFATICISKSFRCKAAIVKSEC